MQREGNDQWKKCKYLGTMLDTIKDIKRRKMVMNDVINKVNHMAKDRQLNTDNKVRVLDAYAVSVFLYYSETLTVTRSTSDSIDIFHRMLRSAITVKWPKKISFEKL